MSPLLRLPLFPDEAWIDPELKERFIPGVSEPGPIRLACGACDREDFDGFSAYLSIGQTCIRSIASAGMRAGHGRGDAETKCHEVVHAYRCLS